MRLEKKKSSNPRLNRSGMTSFFIAPESTFYVALECLRRGASRGLRMALFTFMAVYPVPMMAAPAAPAGAAAIPNPDSQKIGIVAAAKGSVTIGSQGQVGRVVQTGEAVYLGDTVSTDAEGTLQVLLLDETVFTIGPNSSIIIDKFIYDPANQTGQVNAKVVKGVFRFVTGKIARKKPSDMKVDLPSGSIGVRGTIVSGETNGIKSTVILLGPGARHNTEHRIGQITVGNQVGNEFKQVTVTRPGFGTVIEGSGLAPSLPFQIPAMDLQRIASSLEPAAAAKQMEQGPGGGDPTEQAGQARAGAGESVKDNGKLGRFFQRFARETDRAAQLAIIGEKVQDGIAKFDDLKRVQTGVFHYFKTSAVLLRNSSNSGDTYTFDMDINFGSRTVGGTGSQNQMKATIGTPSPGTTVIYPITSIAFGSGSNSAIFNYQNVAATGGSCGGSCGTADITVTLNNHNGVVADTASNTISFLQGPQLYEGSSTTGPRS